MGVGADGRVPLPNHPGNLVSNVKFCMIFVTFCASLTVVNIVVVDFLT